MSTLYSTSNLAPGVSFGWFVPVSGGFNPPETDGIVLPQQTHTSRFGILTDINQEFPETDAIVTGLKGVAIGIRTADCIPIVAYAPDIKMTAAIHAGWRGTIAGIAPHTLGYLISRGAAPSLLQVRFGPGICGDCYEVSPELAEQFTRAGFGECIIHRGSGVSGEGKINPSLDLIGANIISLHRLGIPSCNIVRPTLCTRHSEISVPGAQPRTLPSWRRTPGLSDRLVTWIRQE